DRARAHDAATPGSRAAGPARAPARDRALRAHPGAGSRLLRRDRGVGVAARHAAAGDSDAGPRPAGVPGGLGAGRLPLVRVHPPALLRPRLRGGRRLRLPQPGGGDGAGDDPARALPAGLPRQSVRRPGPRSPDHRRGAGGRGTARVAGRSPLRPAGGGVRLRAPAADGAGKRPPLLGDRGAHAARLGGGKHVGAGRGLGDRRPDRVVLRRLLCGALGIAGDVRVPQRVQLLRPGADPGQRSPPVDRCRGAGHRRVGRGSRRPRRVRAAGPPGV
ncbi:MAG: hypothetical protein AVDCRST_MAG19-1349, partial [uncultured Thermomicrobiales bacterium]